MKVALEPDDHDIRHKKDKPPVDIPGNLKKMSICPVFDVPRKM